MSVQPDSQTDFVASLLDPEKLPPDNIAPLRNGQPAVKRFTVYRNNVVLSLTDNLRAAYPTVASLVGDEFFDAMAGVYVRQHPPHSPLMMTYGRDFADFLDTFPPAQSVPYLGDMARLEDARRQAYHAKDREPASTETYRVLEGETAIAACLELHPALRTVGSRWPILSIWKKNAGHLDGALPSGGEDVLITRPQLDVEMYPLGAGDLAFISALQQGGPLGVAAGEALADADDFDLSVALARLIRSGSIVDVGIDI